MSVLVPLMQTTLGLAGMEPVEGPAASAAPAATHGEPAAWDAALAMHPYLLSLILGVVEGITEFLPVSSTAHLRFVQEYAGAQLDDPFWKLYAIVIQLGAVLCLPIYFRRKIVDLLVSFPRGSEGDRNLFTHPLSLVLIAFLVTAGPAFFLARLASDNLESLYVMGAALLIGGVLMWVIDVYMSRPRTFRMERMGVFQAVMIGLSQVVAAVFPGTSRSMATIATGQLVGLNRSTALEFSFFLSLPTMLAACTYDLWKTLLPGEATGIAAITPRDLTYQQWMTLAIGFVVSFLVAWAVVVWFMRWVQSRGFTPFAIWRIVLGLGVLWWAFSGAEGG